MSEHGLAIIRGLSLTQPWASLVALGHKRIETRSWSTNYRGWVAIHAARGFPADAKAFAEVECALGRIPKRIPRGAVVAIARLDRVLHTEEVALGISGLERHLGDYSRGRYAWLLADVRALPDPIPCRGALSLWVVPPDVHRHIADAILSITNSEVPNVVTAAPTREEETSDG